MEKQLLDEQRVLHFSGGCVVIGDNKHAVQHVICCAKLSEWFDEEM